MSKNIDKLANVTNDSGNLFNNSDVDDFEKMLNDFISQEFDDEQTETSENTTEDEDSEDILISEEETDTTNFSTDTNESSQQESSDVLLSEREFSLLRAYRNFMYAINILAEENNLTPLNLHLTEEKLYPHYKKGAGSAVSRDVLRGWDILLQLFAKDLQNLNPSSSDDELLDFAEKCTNENLQLAVISHVETMIELEGCEIDYQARKLKYERHLLEKEIYEEHQRRLNRAKKYIDAIKAKGFPIDAERLVNNYFRLSNKDPEGSFKALTNNPATFAPIDFSKIKDRFFGLIKVKPQDGIRINRKIGDFLRKLKA